MSAATTCPECGRRVSAYAAGCENCGADLEAHARRARLAAANAPPPRGASKLRASLGRRVGRLGVTPYEAGVTILVVLTLAWLPALALIPIGLAIMHFVFEGRRGWTALFVAFAVLALVLAYTG